MFGSSINSTVLTILNPLQAIIANYIQAQTGYSLVEVGYVGWGCCWIFVGWAMRIWGGK
jgi:hypothetical protein